MVTMGAKQVAQKKQQAGVIKLKAQTMKSMKNKQKFCMSNERDHQKRKTVYRITSVICALEVKHGI